MQTIVAFQGLGPRDCKSLYQIPEIGTAIRWGQEVLASHNIQVEGGLLDLVRACQEGGLVLQEHSQTCWQQPCIFLASMAYWKLWRNQNPGTNPVLLGFSFGEWTAAVAAGCMNEETGLLTATMRGILTSSAGGSSLLVSTKDNRLPIKRIRLLCRITGNAWLANINSSTQGLISGQGSALAEISESLEKHFPGIRVRPFSVGGAFHTPIMRKAQNQLTRWLKPIKFQKPEFPILLNATRETSSDPEEIKRMLLRQLSARFNFKKLAEGLSRDARLHELCLEASVMGPLIQQTHRIRYGTEASRLVALPFPA